MKLINFKLEVQTSRAMCNSIGIKFLGPVSRVVCQRKHHGPITHVVTIFMKESNRDFCMSSLCCMVCSANCVAARPSSMDFCLSMATSDRFVWVALQQNQVEPRK